MIHIKDVEKISEVDLREPNYSFDLLGLWRDEKGFYLGTDSGCSCPTPWESHTKNDLTGPLTLDQTVEEATSLWAGAGKYDAEAFKGFLVDALTSFQTGLDTRLKFAKGYDLNRSYIEPLTVIDSEGKTFTREGGIYEDLTNFKGDYITAYDESIVYPVTVVGD
mgnify:CR=1 FL=1